MTKLYSLSLLLFVIALPCAAKADWTKISPDEFKMKPFPKDGSAAHKRDYEVLKEHQETRDKASCALARRQAFPNYKVMFEGRPSPLTTKQSQDASELVSRVMRFTLKMSSFYKKKFGRERPYDADSTIHPCAPEPEGNKSYPSGHAAAATAGACVLALIYPEKGKEILEYGESLGELRVIVGVHHPSDVAAGQQLGRDVCERVQEESDFQQELKQLTE